jgi:diguanylate cyclase (GGDEF)-like protein
MIDIDRLKEINDSNGHMIGDIMIKSIASEIKTHIRDSDFAIRYGGDEMVLVLPVTQEEGATELIEKIRKRVGTLEVMGKDGPFSLTISSGIVSLRPKDSLTTDPTELLRAADQALYKAKAEGRNQTWIAREAKTKDGKVIFESKPVSQIKP